MDRKEALQVLMQAHNIEIPRKDQQNFNVSNVEDLYEYLWCDKVIEQWAAVTVGHDNDGYEVWYIYPDFTNPADAQKRAMEYITDDIFEEVPVEVVDLDNGTKIFPQWHTLQWKESSSV